ncbi:MAG: phage tail protein, partial [Rhodocyclaceae bacterium]|nr:phage tail protein [Rhodocyclaceae bacterium]
GINGQVARVSAATTTSVTLEGVNTTSVQQYPVGSGIGTVRKVNSYTQLSQIVTSAASGGEQQFVTFQFLEANSESQIPTKKTALAMSLSVADDVTLPGYIIAKAANDDKQPRAVKFSLPGGGIISHNAYITVTDLPSLTQNEIMANTVTMSLVAQPIRYAV